MYRKAFQYSLFTFTCLSWLALPGLAQNGNGNNNNTSCTVNGKTYKYCPPALASQSKREAARLKAGPQKRGVTRTFAGVSIATATLSPLSTGLATTAAMTPGAKPDYFGIANYANSPLPQIDPTTGAIVPGTGIRKFVDVLPGLCSVSGPTPTLGQCIPLAQKDTTVSFAGDAAPGASDFYRIGLGQFSIKMHSDLPKPTALKGYVDLTTGNFGYLGPLILATRNRPVRVLFQNNLAPLTTPFVPVDMTYMGAGMVNDGTNMAMASDQRSVLHLHGGNTPWISDGTPHQWITPASDPAPNAVGFSKGFGFQNVPDMLNVLGTPTLKDGKGTYYWTNQQSGRLMFYHDHSYGITRLNVYAGEAAGYLLVDPAQESALAAATAPGTIVTDPTTGNITSADLQHMIPLVIQDKTFVPDDGIVGGQLAAQDPTWDVANWGGAGSLWFPHIYIPNQNPADITGANGWGRWDYGPWFWPPQNPNTFVSNGVPYQCTSIGTPPGGWAYPPLMCPGTPLPSGTPEGFMDTPVVNGTAYPTLTVAPAAYRFQMLNAANDRALNLGLYVAEPVTLSPVILAPGSGYTAPTVTIGNCTGGTAIAQLGAAGDIVGITITNQPSACSGTPTITVADTAPGTGSGATVSVVMSQNTDVHMVPAIPASAGRTMLNCSVSQMLPMAGGGQVTALLDASGNPLNGTGLPSGCWPLYSSAQGYTAGSFGENGQLSWGNSDARVGGVPDPTTAGPPIIQIGAEGGVLPKVAVIPSTPISYDYNKRSITVLNVLNHGLFLGPAERADIIVDFSAFAGKTLILYNDAPAPIPAGDPRLDYYTNDPDNSMTGGAPTTMAGYGPNMRTIMQIQVTGTNPNTTPFSLSSLTSAVPNLFAATQDPIIVPETVYPASHGGATNDTYIKIQDTSVSAWIGGPVGSLTLASGGGGYTTAPAVTVAPPPGGIQATATATLSPTTVASLTLTNGGSGYTSAPAVSITGGGGTGAAATATLSGRSVASVTVTKNGSGYSSIPTVTFSAPPAGGTTATGTAVVSNRKVMGVTITNPGTGYVTAPTINFTGGGGTGAAATATLAPASVATITLVTAGSGYTSVPTVTIAPPQTGTAATATAALTGTTVNFVTLTNAGSGYTSAPAVTVAPPASVTGTTALVVANAPTVPLQPKTIQELFTLDYGRMNATMGVEVPFTNFLTQTTIPYGYVDPPTELFKDGETQLWKITHNGVDTHFIHFHLFTVQVINRVGWDGAIKPPDPYELGLKDTVRMNPLEDIIVALRPVKQQTLPWAIPNSYRPMDVTMPTGSAAPNQFTNIDPTNQPAAVTNSVVNFGWEYVWHCHILGHEENDMMRPMILAVTPASPAAPGVLLSGSGTSQRIQVTVSATATAGFAVPSGFTIQRAVVTGGVPGTWTTIGTAAPASPPVGLTSVTATFTDSSLARKTTYAYRAVSNNLVGYTQTYAAPAAGYPHLSADSAPSTIAQITTN